MKKLIFLSLLTFSGITYSQSFEKGARVFQGGIGLGIYHSELSDDKGNSDDDGAASTMFPFSFEMGVTDRFGAGAEFIFSNYFIGDSSDLTSAKAFDFDILMAFHIVNGEKFNMSVNGYAGASSFKARDDASATLKDFGFNYKFDLSLKLYFTDNFGMYLRGGPAFYSYPSLTLDSDNSDPVDYKFKMTGTNLGIGATLKF